MMKQKTKKRLRISLVSLLALIVLLAGAFYVYTLDYYRADAKAQQTFEQSAQSVPGENGMSVFLPKGDVKTSTGLIFYPGGKVEAKAYAPLLEALAAKGYTTVLLDMPFNLAVFGINSADRVYQAFPDIENWFLSGHSLGGAMASAYSKNHTDKLAGLILLGAYPLQKTELPTLVLYGTNDHGITPDKLTGVESIEIKGGNHAYFGDYGEQKGDGTATIQREDQQNQAVEAIDTFIKTTIAI